MIHKVIFKDSLAPRSLILVGIWLLVIPVLFDNSHLGIAITGVLFHLVGLSCLIIGIMRVFTGKKTHDLSQSSLKYDVDSIPKKSNRWAVLGIFLMVVIIIVDLANGNPVFYPFQTSQQWGSNLIPLALFVWGAWGFYRIIVDYYF